MMATITRNRQKNTIQFYTPAGFNTMTVVPNGNALGVTQIYRMTPATENIYTRQNN